LSLEITVSFKNGYSSKVKLLLFVNKRIYIKIKIFF